MSSGFSDGVFVRDVPVDLGPVQPKSTQSLHDGMALPSVGLFADPPELNDIDALVALIRLAMPKNEQPSLLAHALLTRFGSFAATLTASIESLRSVGGVGPYMLSSLAVFREAAVRLKKADLSQCEVLSDRRKLYSYLSAVLAREVIEQFRILFLDKNGLLISDEAQARGTVNHTPVYPREVVRRALELQADSLVLVHNHPSGDPAPSAEDMEMTRRVSEAAAVLGIEVRDHVIVGNGKWLSFSEKGLLQSRKRR